MFINSKFFEFGIFPAGSFSKWEFFQLGISNWKFQIGNFELGISNWEFFEFGIYQLSGIR